ncbi:hypothetical protein ACIHFC_03565 [Streptomyces sp. NPDC052013]|uniref:hypothetical protein n=1 Tax=Streptomyces sp. NPDC052013 TaxID=3365679 RepID=UPI0037D6DBE8
MAHVEPSDLLELALGRTVPGDDAGVLLHLAECASCRAELRRTARVVAAARGAVASHLLIPPPERVWQRISCEVRGPAPGNSETGEGGRHDEEGSSEQGRQGFVEKSRPERDRKGREEDH